MVGSITKPRRGLLSLQAKAPMIRAQQWKQKYFRLNIKKGIKESTRSRLWKKRTEKYYKRVE